MLRGLWRWLWFGGAPGESSAVEPIRTATLTGRDRSQVTLTGTDASAVTLIGRDRSAVTLIGRAEE